MQTIPGTLTKFFSVLCEYVFEARLGVADPPVVDYDSDLLLRCVRNDSIGGVRTPAGRQTFEVADMLAEAENRVGIAKRDVHRHIGDFTLFWTGVYPEALNRLRSRMTKDQFIDYCAQGKRSYYIASTFDDDPYRQEAPVLRRLSEGFELCAYGLSQVRREW